MRLIAAAALALVLSAPGACAACSSPYQADAAGNCVLEGAIAAAPANGWLSAGQAALSATVVAVKTSGGQLSTLVCNNPNSAVIYVQVFDAANGSVILGATAPKFAVPIPPNSLNGGFALGTVGAQFATAISLAATTTPTGSTAPGTGLVCAEFYE
jgi:hypothetical protein